MDWTGCFCWTEQDSNYGGGGVLGPTTCLSLTLPSLVLISGGSLLDAVCRLQVGFTSVESFTCICLMHHMQAIVMMQCRLHGAELVCCSCVRFLVTMEACWVNFVSSRACG